MTGGPYSELLRRHGERKRARQFQKTGDGYSLQQATDAIQSVQRALNKALGLEKLKVQAKRDDLALSENESADDYNDTVNAQRNSPERKNVRGDSLENSRYLLKMMTGSPCSAVMRQAASSGQGPKSSKKR